ncbi:MAG TPA: HEAT repeat domain-containing protein, partial [Pilimelia sp.]|nr:HEAT repeat domain-containing protein [Pilimelia sp.]
RALAHRALPAHLVARALADLGPAAAHALVDAIGPAAAHEVRATAVDALGMLGVPAAAAAVIDLLDDADAPVDVRVSAARALGELGTRSSLRPLQAALRPGLPVPLRVAAAAALGSVGAPAAAPALADLLHDPHYAVAHAAAAALRQVGAAGQRALRETTAGADLAAAHARESLALAELYRAARAQTVRG